MLSDLDLRIQRERFSSEEDYEAACRDYEINDKTMHHARRPDRPIVLHPLPRVNEIAREFDLDLKRAAYFRQAENGLYVRMALLAMVLGKC